jgi:ABC-2 type transport system ATP-binding protein
MTDDVVITHRLSKRYGTHLAVKELNLSIKRHRITAFLGRNGAGKSSTIKMLLGMVRPSSGSGIVLGKNISDSAASRDLRQRVAYVAEDKPLYGYMTVEQLVFFAKSFYSDWREDVEKRLLSDFELPIERKIRKLSKGMRTKLALLLAFSRNPEFLILDEPTEGLDPVGIEYLLSLLVTQAAEGTSVFFSSHQIAEVERVADDVCILEKGKLLVEQSLDELRQSYRRIDLVFQSVAPENEFHMLGVKRIETHGHQLSVFVHSNADAVMERARSLNALSVEASHVGLREIFLETVKEESGALV